MGVEIRQGTPRDDLGVAEVHVAGWRWAYRGVMPDHVLGTLSVERRAARRRGFIEETGAHTWVAERDGRVLGFVMTGPPIDQDGNLLATDGSTEELYAIYLDPPEIGTGLGRRLLARATEDLREREVRTAVLWVLEANTRARRFYEAAGWRPDGLVREYHTGEQGLPELRYAIALPPERPGRPTSDGGA